MEGTVAATPGEEMAVQEVTMPSGAQVPDPGGKVPGRKKKGATNSIGVPTVTTRSMQKQKSLTPCKPIESLPSISGVLVRAIASCELDKGFSYSELKEVLSAKGYNVSRHCPNIKRKLHSLVSKGALVRMTRSNGSTLFVVRKYLETDNKTFGSSEKIVGIKKAGAECASENVRGEAKQRRSSGRKIGEASRKLQSPNRKLQPGEKQPRQSTSKSSSVKRVQSLLRKVVSTTERSVSAGSNAVSKTKRPHRSSGKAASASKRARNNRSRGASSSKKKGRPVGKITSERSRCSNSHASAKGQGSPYSKEKLNMKKTSYCRSKKAAPAKEHRSTRRKTAFPQQRLKGSAASSTKGPSRS